MGIKFNPFTGAFDLTGSATAGNMRFLGYWDNLINYVLNDVVIYDSIAYICIAANHGGPPGSFPALWTQMAYPDVWLLDGNTGTAGAAKIGTSDAQPFNIVTSNASRLTVNADGSFATIQNVVPTNGIGFKQWSQQTNLTGSANTASASFLHDSKLVSFDTGGFNLSQSVGVVSSTLGYSGSGTTGSIYLQDHYSNLAGTGLIANYTGLRVGNNVGAGQTVTNFQGRSNNATSAGGTITNLTGDANSINLTDVTSTNVNAGITQVFVSGTSTITNTVNALSPYIQVNDSATLTNGAAGQSVGIDINNTATVNSVNGSNVYLNARNAASVGGINGVSFSLNQENASTSTGTNGFNTNLQYSGTSTAQGVNAVNLYARTFGSADLSSLTMVNASPEVEGNSVVDNVTIAGLYGQIKGNAVTQNVTGINVNPVISANAVTDNLLGAQIHAQTTSTIPTTNGITGLRVQVSSTAGELYVKGIEVNMNTATLSAVAMANSTQKIGLDIQGGAVNASYNYTIPGSAFFANVHAIGGVTLVAAGDPVVNALMIANNFGQGLNFADDWGPDFTGLGLGFVGLGCVGEIQGAAGKVAYACTQHLSGVSNTLGSGTVTNFYGYRSIGVLPSGGALAITNMYGFHASSPISAIAANSWAFYDETTSDNYFNKIAIGTVSNKVSNSDVALEIGVKQFVPASMSTATKNALAAVAGAIVYDTNLLKLQCYENGAWVSLSSGTGPTDAEEDLTGLIDGVNVTYVLANAPISAASVFVIINGAVGTNIVDYTIAGATITTTVILTVPETISFKYRY